MILTGYFDESGTHSDSVVTALAGYVADARQWRKYEKRAAKLFQRFNVNVFHAVDVKRGDKDFKGWTVDKKIEFLDEFQHIINDTLEFGVAAFVRNEDYSYYRSLEWPRKARADSKYTILFRACIAHVIDHIPSINIAAEPRLYIVLEDGHPNAKDALRAYNFAKERLGDSLALSGLTFGGKKQSIPLAAADLFAYTAWGKEAEQKPIGIAKRAVKADASYRGNCFRVML